MDYSVFDLFPNLVTERLTLQLHQENDLDDLYILRSDYDVMKYMDQAPATDKQTVLGTIKDIQQDYINKAGINWTIKLKGQNETIGYMSLWKIDHSNHRVELGYALKKEYWRKGITYEAAQAVIDFTFHKLKAHSIMANINPDNSASEALLLKLGFKQEALFRENYHYNGQFFDSVIYCLIVSDWI